MPRLLAIADEVCDTLYGEGLLETRPDVVVSCGDLPFEYLEYIVTMVNVPLLYVPGNHDPEIKERSSEEALAPAFLTAAHHDFPGPSGCVNIDGRVADAAGLRIAGLGGSIRYSRGPNQYTQREMKRRAIRLELRCRTRALRDRKRVDVLLSHVPPSGLVEEDDPAHQGAHALHRLIRAVSPSVLLYGHVHPYGMETPVRHVGGTRVVNAVGYSVLDVP